MTEAEVPWYVEVWSGFRPYLIRVSLDFLISGLLWLSLFLFKSLTQLLPIAHWAAEFIEKIHTVGALVAFVLFGVLFAVDIYALHHGAKE